MRKVKATPKNYIWAFDEALKLTDNEAIKEMLRYGKSLEERRLEEQTIKDQALVYDQINSILEGE